MQKKNISRVKYLTVSAMLCALGVIFLSLGSLFEVLDLSVAVLASLLCVYAVIEIGGAYPWGIWVVTSLLALLLLPQKSPAIFYSLFLGFYPILKEKIERRSRLFSFLFKLLIFHVCLGCIYFVFKLFLPGVLDEGSMLWLGAVLYFLSLLCFILYDFALTRLITFYLLRLRKNFRIR